MLLQWCYISEPPSRCQHHRHSPALRADPGSAVSRRHRDELRGSIRRSAAVTKHLRRDQTQAVLRSLPTGGSASLSHRNSWP